MSKKFELSAESKKKYDQLLSRYDDVESLLLPTLHMAQDEHGYLSDEVVTYVSELMNVPEIRIREVISFYDMFYDKPTAKNIVHVCTNISCSMYGGRDIHQSLLNHFKTENMQPTKDGRFFIQKMECLGYCEQAPVMRINNKYHGNVTIDKAINILSEL